MNKPIHILLPIALLSIGVAGLSLGEDKGSNLSGLLNTLRENVKDLDTSSNLSELPKQFAELKKNYAAQTETVSQLQQEVAALRAELEALKREVQLIKGGADVAEEIRLN